MLLKQSVSYQLVLFNRSCKGWYYKLNGSEARILFIRCSDKLRQFNLKMEVSRFYIPKPNGKIRPIGSPSVFSLMLSKALSDMAIMLFKDELSENHHGFLPERGIHTALVNICHNYYIRGMTNLYEFDLRS